MKVLRLPWQQLVILAIIGLLLLNSIRTLQQSVIHNPNELASVDVQPAAQQALRLKPWLPPRGYIGYMSDNPDASSYFRQYYATQYALAPLMFVPLGKIPQGLPFASDVLPTQQALVDGLVIGNFRDPVRLQAAIQIMNLEEIARANTTMVLLRQRASAAQSMGGAQTP
jgi:hypothetical protein